MTPGCQRGLTCLGRVQTPEGGLKGLGRGAGIEGRNRGTHRFWGYPGIYGGQMGMGGENYRFGVIEASEGHSQHHGVLRRPRSQGK